jgi:hypothetical protein
MPRFTPWVALATLALALPLAAPAGAREGPDAPQNALEFSPLSPVIDIYALQYARALGGRDELLLGASYANIEYDHGRSHAPGLIVGYRRYVWRRAHLEYQLWPSYNRYHEYVERRYYDGFELWNEFRPGWTFDFRAGRVPAFVNLQCLIGFALVGGNKPQSFKDQVEDEPVFVSPMFFLGWRW